MVAERFRVARALVRAHSTWFERPDRLPRAALAAAPWGATLAAGVAAAAARYPDRAVVIDETGAHGYADVWRRSRRLAGALVARGIGPGSRVGLFGRNHVGFVEWLVAASATGADVVLLNTGSAATQLADVVAAEGLDLVLHDDDLADVARAAGGTAALVDESTADALAASGRALAPRRHQGAVVILTSGTTGRPKGATRRSDASAIVSVAGMLERVPFRLGDVQVVPAPLFHAWGLSNLLGGITRSATTVLARRFDPEDTLRSLTEHRARVLVVVPVMLARMLELGPDVLARYPTPDLEVIAASGSAIGGDLVTRVLDHFGPVLHNLYGSTEVSVATIADPADLRRAPTTAGRVVRGVRVAVLDPDGRPVADGESGEIFVGAPGRFDGYTNGTTKPERDGMLSSGDVGRFERGLLFVEGRIDDMVVSGGENVHPGEVEELLTAHPGVREVAVVGVPDERFGQALAAFVVAEPGSGLGPDDVVSHVREHLARHQVPRRVELVDELPRTTTGKVLRRVLAEGSST